MSRETTKKKRRAYIGNLRPRPNLSNNLYNDLFIPHCLSVNNNTDGISVIQPKYYSKITSSSSSNNNNSSSSVYALVEFQDVDYAIQVLNGVQFDGRVLRVSKEKTNFGGSGGGGFGSSRWAGSNFDGGGRSSNNFPRGKNNSGQNRQSKPKSSHDSKSTPMSNGVNNDEQLEQNNLNSNGIIMDSSTKEETIIKGIESTISCEIQQSTDEITTAIACTAAMTLLSSVDAFGLGDDKEKDVITESKATASSVSNNCVDNVNDMTNQDFQSRCQMPLSDLLSEYGEEDVDWMKHKQRQQQQQNSNSTQLEDVPSKSEKDISIDDFQSRCQMPISSLLAEYGEQDVDWKKEQHHHQSSSSSSPPSNTQDSKHQGSQSNHSRENNNNNNDDNGMLAHFNKAFIHLELVSFGYKYGAPSHSKRGFTYTHPLPPIDIRDLDRCPGHIGKFNGLHYLVKKALLNPTKRGDSSANENIDNDEQVVDSQITNSSQSPMRLRANQIADEVIKILVESIEEGGHGPVSPLTMTISIGSEYGRHRSAVLVEHLGVILRSRLRKNDGRCFNEEESGLGKNGIVKQPVSVSTRHRDVTRHRNVI